MMVCLDLTDIDPSLIEYASFLSQTLETDKVIFFHAIQAYDLPDKSSKKFPDLQSSLSNTIQEEINSVVSSHFKRRTKTEVITKIEDEDAANVINDFIEKEEVDLALIGQKYGEDREGRYGQKIAASAKADLLFVPENPSLSVNHILNVLDLSKESEKAFIRTRDIAQVTGAEITCYYIYDTSKSYFPASTHETSSAFQKQFQKKFRKYLKKFDLTPKDVYGEFEVNDELKSQAEKLYNKAERMQADLIIIGAKGQTSSFTSLLGNVSENLRRMEKEIPVMIMKNRKKKGAGLLPF